MKKLLSFLLVFVLLLSSCGGNDSKIIEDLCASLTPPLKMRILITADKINAEANVSFNQPTQEITMSVEFVSPSIINGLKVERHKDGRLFADYEGVISELDDKALNMVSTSCDILQLIREDMISYGKVVKSIDERYGQIDLEVNNKIVNVFFDKDTLSILRINSELFDVPVRIDIIDMEHVDTTISGVLS